MCRQHECLEGAKRGTQVMNRKCQTPGCKCKARKDRRECTKCSTARYRKNNPCMTKYHTLKCNAKRRNVHFDITYKEWERWCEENNYLELCGVGAADMTVDRDNPDPEIGYTYHNMKMRTKQENSAKGEMDKSILHQKNEKWLQAFMDDIAREKAEKSAQHIGDDPPF